MLRVAPTRFSLQHATEEVLTLLEGYAMYLAAARKRPNPVLMQRIHQTRAHLDLMRTSERGATVATYAYVCRSCGEQFEVKRPMSERATLDAQPPVCPKCGKNDVQKVVSMFTAIKDWRTT